MIRGHLLRLVLLISCAHGLVHVYELALPSVEQQVAAEFNPTDVARGKELTGYLSNSWRLTWGFGALVAGWLVDRFGGRRMLAIYLLGCGCLCLFVAFSLARSTLFLSMLVMGAFASIYHPAGLALISHETTAEDRPPALGIHGIFGSLGIGSAPLIAGLLLQGGFVWRQYYYVLAVPGLLLGCYFALTARQQRPTPDRPAPASLVQVDETVQWRSFFWLTCIAVLQGFIYSAMMSFLPRYVSDSQLTIPALKSLTIGKFGAGLILIMGCLGQFLAGKWARSSILERQLAFVLFANVPFLVWMGIAQGWNRVIAAGLFAVVHFMHQPIYNSLIPKYTPRHRRSLCYGFSFAMGLGVGSFGAAFGGRSTSDLWTYSVLAVIAFVAGTWCLILWRMQQWYDSN